MRRGVTVLVVVVVAAIALAAGIDALRSALRGRAGRPDRDADRPTTEPEGRRTTCRSKTSSQARSTTPTRAASCGRSSCPPRRRSEAPGWDECRFVLSPSEQRVSGAGSGWDPYSDPNVGRLYQSEQGRIQVATNLGPDGEPFRGEAPAWRPDGALTYFADGAVREWPSGDVVLSQRDLVRALRTLPFVELATRFDRFRVREAAWLDERRLAAILSANGPEGRVDMLAIYDGRELDAVHLRRRWWVLGAARQSRRTLCRREVDRRPRRAGIRHDRGRPRGEHAPDRRLPRVAWSPDEQWVAIAAEGGVFVYHPGAPGPPELELDLDAHDLAWRGEAGPPALARAG